jgi:hypothetical protein
LRAQHSQNSANQNNNSSDTIGGGREQSMTKSDICNSTSNNSMKIYIPKAICLLSKYPFYDYFTDILEDLYSAQKTDLTNTIEAYITNLVLQVINHNSLIN